MRTIILHQKNSHLPNEKELKQRMFLFIIVPNVLCPNEGGGGKVKNKPPSPNHFHSTSYWIELNVNKTSKLFSYLPSTGPCKEKNSVDVTSSLTPSTWGVDKGYEVLQKKDKNKIDHLFMYCLSIMYSYILLQGYDPCGLFKHAKRTLNRWKVMWFLRRVEPWNRMWESSCVIYKMGGKESSMYLCDGFGVGHETYGAHFRHFENVFKYSSFTKI